MLHQELPSAQWKTKTLPSMFPSGPNKVFCVIVICSLKSMSFGLHSMENYTHIISLLLVDSFCRLTCIDSLEFMASAHASPETTVDLIRQMHLAGRSHSSRTPTLMDVSNSHPVYQDACPVRTLALSQIIPWNQITGLASRRIRCSALLGRITLLRSPNPHSLTARSSGYRDSDRHVSFLDF